MYASLLFLRKLKICSRCTSTPHPVVFINSITDEKAIIQGNLRIFGNSQLSLMLRLFFLTFEKNLLELLVNFLSNIRRKIVNCPDPFAMAHPNGASSAHGS